MYIYSDKNHITVQHAVLFCALRIACSTLETLHINAAKLNVLSKYSAGPNPVISLTRELHEQSNISFVTLGSISVYHETPLSITNWPKLIFIVQSLHVGSHIAKYSYKHCNQQNTSEYLHTACITGIQW